MNLIEELKKTKQASYILSQCSVDTRNQILQELKKLLSLNTKGILEANAKDIEQAHINDKNSAFIDRLTLTENSISQMVSQLDLIIHSPDPLNAILVNRATEQGITLHKVSVPLGVIAIIYESRPNVTIDAGALCIKSGNAVVLRGGSDALHSNTFLAGLIYQALGTQGIPKEAVNFILSADRTIVHELLKQAKYIDVVIPRGGYELVTKVVNESTIPLLYHASGGARIFVDKDFEPDLALKVLLNAKISRPATCNSLNTVLLHEEIVESFAPELIKQFKDANVEIRASKNLAQQFNLKEISPEDHSREYLDNIVNLVTVPNINEAINYIITYSNGHTEGIISTNRESIDTFTRLVNPATIMINCSTRLHDGFIFGLGAEMGIATGKLHARGPVGLNELTTYKWIAYGNGQTR